MKNDRLFQLLYLLLEKGCMTSQELANRIETTPQSLSNKFSRDNFI